MTKLEEQIKKIDEKLTKGVTPKRLTPRHLLDLVGVSRRGCNVNWRIRSVLDKYRLKTLPRFDWASIDSPIAFVRVESEESENPTLLRIDGLEAANRKPTSIAPTKGLTEAITIMLSHDFSQLPVMSSARDVKGAVSWKSIGSRLALKKKVMTVSDCMDPAIVAKGETSLFKAISLISEHDYVLVQAIDKTVSGIVTASDLSEQFKDLAEPFLLIGECENLIRQLIHGKYSQAELNDAKNDSDVERVIEGVADLTFGEYIRLLENPDRWQKLDISIDRKQFIHELGAIRLIRNDIMHFEPKGIAPESLKILHDFFRFLQDLRRYGAF